MSIENTLTEFESFLEHCKLSSSLSTYTSDSVLPISLDEIKSIHLGSNRQVPTELEIFYNLSNFSNFSIEGKNEEFGFASTQFSSLAMIPENLEWWACEDVIQDEELNINDVEDDEREGYQLRLEQLKFGLPIYGEDSFIVVDSRNGSVSRYSDEPSPSDKIASSFNEFLTHFIASGCFDYGSAEKIHFDKYWDIIKDIAPFDIAPKENLWLKHLDRWYDGDITK